MFHIIVLLYCLAGSGLLPVCLASKVYGLCDIDEVITSLNGSITESDGDNCQQTLLAPQGWRIRLTMYDLYLVESYLWIYDGGRVYAGLENIDYPPGHRSPSGTEIYSSSNTMVIHTERITSEHSRLNFSFTMFPQSANRCACPPVSSGKTLCTLRTSFNTGDSLKRSCQTSCDKGYNVFTSHHPDQVSNKQDTKWTCDLDQTKDESEAQWDGKVDGGGAFSPIVLDVNLITCSKSNPVTQVKSIYSFNYMSTCEKLDLGFIEDKVAGHLIDTVNSSYTGQCFREIVANMNCTVNRMNATCSYSSSKNKSLVRLIIQDNIEENVNITMTEQLFAKLIKEFTNIIPNILQDFINQQLHVNNESATNFQVVSVPVALKTCPDNYAPTIEIVNIPRSVKCVPCPIHFEKRQTFSYTSCAQCEGGQRRKLSEDKCVRGQRNYTKRSFAWCPHTCALGKFFNNDSGLCEWCPYGTYQNSTSDINPVCHKCRNGTSTAFVGAHNETSDCIYLCSPGYYMQDGSCLECRITYYMPHKNHHFHKCYKCPNGKTTIQKATCSNTSCVDICNMGQYFNISRGICLSCPNNTYQNETKINNINSCNDCPDNTVTGKVGSQNVKDCLGPCNAGQFVDMSNSGCSPCPKNTYFDIDKHVSFTCKTCDKYKVTQTAGSTNISDCIYTCDKGDFFNESSKLCQKCQIGYYQNEEGKDFCKSCKGKSFTLAVGSSQCIQPCMYGEFLNKSAEECQDCQQGHFQNITEHQLTTCLPCPLDYYNDQIGRQNCTLCPDQKITLGTATEKTNECIDTCEPGLFLNKTRKTCQECFQGYYQSQMQYRLEHCTKCPYANQTTIGTGATSLEQCVGYCASSPCLNGGECIDVDYGFNCTCPKHLEGERCEIITDEKDTDTIETSIRLTSQVWSTQLLNPESLAYKELATDIENNIRKELESEPTFRKVKVTEFTQGSVISIMEIDYVSGPDFTTPIDTLQSVIGDGKLGNMIVDNSSLQILNYTCKQPLGMENRRIPDEAITSGNEENHYPPSNARLNFNGTGWTPRIIYLKKAYLQVDFQQEVLLTGIATQGSQVDDQKCWLNGYWMNYSSDGRNWHTYKGDKIVLKVFGANSDVDTAVRNDIKYPMFTRYVRIIEYTFTPPHTMSYRIEFYGCPVPTTVQLPTKLPPTVTQVTITASTDKIKEEDDDDEDTTNVGLIVGIVVAVVVVVVVILVAVVAWRVRKNRKSFHNVSVRNRMQMTENPKS